jgi:ligand-binding sensor domain-containing protein/signal transduction histidine kinase
MEKRGVLRGARVSLVLVVLAGSARAERLPIKRYTSADGLPHDRIKKIVADSRGFLWFCTVEGLARFDGSTFVSYGIAQGLPMPSTNDVLEVEGKGYWIATNGGGVAFLDPNRRDRARLEIERVGDEPSTSRVNVLLRDRSGRLWAGTDGGLFRRAPAEPGRGVFERVPLGFTEHPDGFVQVWVLAEDTGGVVWAGTKYGLAGVAAGTVLHRQIQPRDTDNVQALLPDEGGGLWVGHENAGLLFFDAGALKSGGPPSRRFTSADGLAEGRVNALHRSGEALFIATLGGLSTLEGGWLTTQGTAQGLSEGRLTALAGDRDGSLWLGTESAGAMKLSRSGFVTFGEEDGLGHAVSGIFERPNGELCVTSTNWLVSRFDGRRFATVRPRLPASLPASRWRFFQTTLEDRAGEWWIATGEGLCRFAKPSPLEELAERPPRAVYTTKDGLADDDVARLFEDARGDIWIGTFAPAGLTRFDRRSGLFRRYGAAEGLPPAVSINAFCEDAAQDLWIGFREGGVARYRAGAFRVFSTPDGFPGSPVVALYADRAGRLWMTTNGGGLIRVDDPASERPRVTVYGARQGIDAYHLTGLVEDSAGRLYVGTTRDLLRLDVATGAVRRYGAEDGVVPSEVVAAHRDREGVLWLASWRGLSRFVPRPERGQRPPAVAIAAVAVSDSPRPLSELGAADVDAGRLEESQSHVAIEFFSLGSGPTVRFQHRLEGLDRDWSPPSAGRSILYASLAPGSYRFLVRALNGEGRASPVPAAVTFTILPPLWRRAWFLASAALAACGVGYALDHARAERRLAVERVRTRIASDLHDDIGASLSRVAVLTEVVKRKAGPEHARRLGDIADLARELVGSMSDIVWATDPKRDDLASVVRRLRTFGSDVLEAAGIAFDCRVAGDLGRVKVGPDTRRRIYLILKESLANVARHSGAVNARLSFRTEGRFLLAELRDDGRGMPSGGARSSGLAHGTVHGIPSMKERAEAGGGSLEIDSAPGAGTAVLLKMPVGSRS